MKKQRLLILAIVLCLFACLFTACDMDFDLGTDITITFMVDGEVYHELEVKNNKTVSLPDNPTKEGYTFAGWYLSEDYEEVFTATYLLNNTVVSNITVYAKWTTDDDPTPPSTFTIHFNSMGGSEVADIVLSEGATFVLPDAPTKEGYTFAGWYLDETTETVFENASQLSDGIVLYAKWVEEHDHSYTTNIIVPDCENDGYTRHTCEVCGHYYDDTIVPATGHSHSAVVTDPTCTEQGYTTHTCACGDSYVDTYVDTTGHTWGEWYETQAPTNTEAGEERRDCDNCDCYETNVLPALGQEDEHSGTLGDLTWTLNTNTGELVIAGTGEMDVFTSDSTDAWKTYENLIKSVTIENGVTSIGEKAFRGCSGLTSITIPNSVTNIGSHTFEECISLTSIDIPTGVTNIGDYAFSGCSSLTSIDIPDSVESIGGEAFGECTSLTSVIIGDGVTSIGNCAFNNCALTSVSIGDSVTSIGEGAFACCVFFESITIPSSVTTIGDSAFEDCSSLTDVYYTGAEEQWNNIAIGSDNDDLLNATIHFLGETNENPALINGTWGRLTWTLNENTDELVISGTGEMDDFERNSTSAWREYKDIIKSVTIKNGVTSIGKYAFDICRSLTSVTFEENSQLTTIDEAAFSYCYSLTSVTFGENSQLTTIGEEAFFACTSLTSIVIPDSVTSIGNGVFICCTSLASIEVDEDNPNYQTIDGNIYSKDGKTLVNYAPGKTETTCAIPDSVTTIGSFAFASCNNLTSVTFGENSQLTSIGYDAFYGCINLTSIDIPDSVTTIDEYAFCDCWSLTRVRFGENSQLTTIGDCAFLCCENLTSIDVPDNVKSIGDSAFVECYSLTSVRFGENSRLTSIGDYAFAGCSLTSIVIPDSVTTIGERAFYLCTSLTDVYYTGTEEQWNNIAIESDNDDLLNATIHFLGEEECQHPTWNHDGSCATCGYQQFKFSLNEGGESYTITGRGRDFNETDLVIPSIFNDKPVIHIYPGAFGEFDDMTSLYIPASIVSIGNEAFLDCDGLVVVIFEENSQLTTIGDWAFSGFNCISITIPDSVTTIGEYVFYWCSSLTDVYYLGTKEQWNEIEIGLNNDDLVTVTIHFLGEEDEEPVLINGTWGDLTWTLNETTGELVISGTGEMDAFTADSTSAWREYKDLIKSVTIENGITSIGEYAFRECTSLTNVTFGENSQLKNFGYGSFYECTSLTNIIIPSNVTGIGSHAFYGCTSLTGITIPSNVTGIGIWAFFGCSSVESIVVDEGNTAFYSAGNCLIGWGDVLITGCKNSVIPSDASLVSIMDGAFAYCNDLTSITIPDGVTNIGYGAFAVCSLTSVVIPSSVTTIGDCAFLSCNSLTDVYYSGTEEQWNAISIGSSNDNLTNATRYYYSECIHNTGSNQWRHDSDGNISTELTIGDWIVDVEATCITDGSKHNECTICHATIETKTIDALGHDEIENDAKEATCTEVGWDAYVTCSRCDYSTYNEIPATDHEYIPVVTPPTCTEQGYTTHTCHCGDSYIDTYVDATGHTEGSAIIENNVDATCTKKGSYDNVVYCATCGVELSRITETIEALGHSEIEYIIQEATCTKDGYTMCKCGLCGLQYVKEYVPRTGHQYDYVEVVEPTCTTNGAKICICTFCEEEITTETSVAVGHQYVLIEYTDELEIYVCEACGEETSVAVGHEHIYQEGVEGNEGAGSNICEICGREITDEIDHTNMHSNVHAGNSSQLVNQETTFRFVVISEYGEQYIREHLVIIDAYFVGSDYEDQDEVVQTYDITPSNEVTNGYIISPSQPYEMGLTYVAKISGNLNFYDHYGTELTFTIIDENRQEAEFSENIKCLRAIEETNPGYYPYEFYEVEGSEYLYLILSKVDDIYIGDILLIGEISDISEIFSTTEEIVFGKVENIYANYYGEFICVLSCPDLNEVFSSLNIYDETAIDFEKHPEVQQILEEQSLAYLYDSDDFACFLASTEQTAQSYASERKLTATRMSKANFADMFKIEGPDVKINGTKISLSFAGRFENEFKTQSGKSAGVFSINFKINMSIEFDVKLNYKLSYWWFIPTGIEMFDFSVTQKDRISIDFSAAYELDYSLNEQTGQYYYHKDSKKLHVEGCIYEERTKDENKIFIGAEELHEYAKKDGFSECLKCQPISQLNRMVFVINTHTTSGSEQPITIHCYNCYHVQQMNPKNIELFYGSYGLLTKKLSETEYHNCGYCQPEKKETLDFEQQLLQTYKYADWSKQVSQIKQWAKSAGSDGYKDPNGITICTLSYPIYILTVNLDIKVVLDFNFEVALNYHYEQSHENVYGMRLQNGKVKPYSTTHKEESESYLTMTGSFDFNVGIRLNGYVSIVGLSRWVQAGIYVEAGAYLEAQGVVYITSDPDVENFAAARFSTGLYVECGCYYKLFGLNGGITILEAKLPLVSLGYDKAYFSYVNDIDDMEINSNTKLDLDQLLEVKSYDVQNGTSSNEILSLYSDLYAIKIYMQSGKYCQIVDGTIIISANAPCCFEDTIIIEVSGKTSWSKYVKNSAAVYLGTRTIDVSYRGDGIHNFVVVETKNSTCIEKGYKIEQCSICQTKKTSELPLGSHNHTAAITSPTCTKQGFTTHTCVCGDSYVDTYVDALGHTEGSVVVENEVGATCTTDGSYDNVVYCTVCEAELSREIKIVDALDHDEIEHIAQAPTCTEFGWDAYVTCSRCDYTTYVEIPATGHNFENKEECTICHAEYHTKGLLFSLCEGGYEVTGIESNLTEVIIPSQYQGMPVLSIGECAFEGCSSLTSITIPDSVTTIGDSAFYDCDSLTSITIPDSVTTIGKQVFYSCNSLTSVYYLGALEQWCGITFGDFDANPMHYADNLYIDRELLAGELIIPNTVIEIKAYTFCNCDSLTSITIPDSVTTIGNYAFRSCDSLASVTFGEDSQLTTIGECAFYYCTSLTSIVIPASVTTIGIGAFYFCDSLTSVTFGENSQLTTIGDSAFYFCGSLTSVTIGNSVTTIGSYAFYACSSLTSVTFGENSQLTTIGGGAFIDCRKLTSIDIPDSVTTIGEEAFYNCKSLTSVTFGENSQLTTIGDYAFDSCTNLTSIEIPNSVTTIGDYAFDGCTSLTSITVDEDNPNYQSIDGNLYSKDGKTLVHYAPGKTETTFAIPDSVTTIGADAFLNCDNLTSVTFGDNSQLTDIGYRAFESCNNLTSIVIPDSVTTIGEEAFYNCKSLTSIDIPDSVTTIGYGAFYNCDSLTSIEIPNSVTTIGSSAFYGCDSLTSIVIPDSVTTIGEWAFYGCRSLTSIVIPDSVTTIGDYAFSSCGSLTSVTFENTTGWYVTKTEGATSGTNLTLTNASTNATYLKSTYRSYYWYKK